MKCPDCDDYGERPTKPLDLHLQDEHQWGRRAARKYLKHALQKQEEKATEAQGELGW